ncbi:MAG TPA: TIGR00725 family protein [Candidatus Dormibacteraeota bacterium]|nr:TIGR00725 family protein [Candidatus Dormibacteraeota bacterium]
MTRGRPPLVAVCGASEATERERALAEECGRELAVRGAVVLCGGLGGVMAAAARGVRSAGGTSVGLLPGDDAGAADADVTIAIPTGLGEIRNALIARSCAAMVAIGGGYGTLAEVALALRLARPVAGLATWALAPPGPVPTELRLFDEPRAAVAWVLGEITARGA